MIITATRRGLTAVLFAAGLAACQSPGLVQSGGYNAPMARAGAASPAKLEADRSAIKAMAGDYKVRFDFQETTAFTQGYDPKDRYLSGGHEVVRVIEDRPGFISLQHILVVGGEQKMPVKHWRQDWIYEPTEVLTFIGGNAWEMVPTTRAERKGKWAQIVYQVDDSPRYGAMAAWSHGNGVSEWTPPARMRPLPRRDMTTRDDYHAVLAVNRHAITPDGWVHEQDNSKLVLGAEPHVLVREIGVNTYTKFADFDVSVAENYWAKTADYWAEVRAAWADLEQTSGRFALTVKGEADDLYMPLLDLSSEIETGAITSAQAAAKARATIRSYTTDELQPLDQRLRTANRDGGTAR